MTLQVSEGRNGVEKDKETTITIKDHIRDARNCNRVKGEGFKFRV